MISLFDQILVNFGQFWIIFGRFWVDLGSGRGLDDDGGIRRRAAESLAGSREGSGTEVGQAQDQILAILALRGQNSRVEVNFGHF